VETLALQLRRADGIERAAFHAQTGHQLDELVGDAVAQHRELGLLEDDGGRVWLTRRGKCVADAVIRGCLRQAARSSTPPAQ
jgi:oxygen-independent coproporphyrinogen-3 oxidase